MSQLTYKFKLVRNTDEEYILNQEVIVEPKIVNGKELHLIFAITNIDEPYAIASAFSTITKINYPVSKSKNDDRDMEQYIKDVYKSYVYDIIQIQLDNDIYSCVWDY